MRIRQFEERDAEAVRELHRVALESAGGFIPGPWNDDLDDIAGVYLGPRSTFLVGESGGELVAMGALREIDEERGEIKRIRVRPASQGRGLGDALLTALEERAIAWGYSTLELDTLADQAAAVRLFRKHGYAQFGSRDFQGQEQLLLRKPLA